MQRCFLRARIHFETGNVDVLTVSVYEHGALHSRVDIPVQVSTGNASFGTLVAKPVSISFDGFPQYVFKAACASTGCLKSSIAGARRPFVVLTLEDRGGVRLPSVIFRAHAETQGPTYSLRVSTEGGSLAYTNAPSCNNRLPTPSNADIPVACGSITALNTFTDSDSWAIWTPGPDFCGQTDLSVCLATGSQVQYCAPVGIFVECENDAPTVLVWRNASAIELDDLGTIPLGLTEGRLSEVDSFWLQDSDGGSSPPSSHRDASMDWGKYLARVMPNRAASDSSEVVDLMRRALPRHSTSSSLSMCIASIGGMLAVKPP